MSNICTNFHYSISSGKCCPLHFVGDCTSHYLMLFSQLGTDKLPLLSNPTPQTSYYIINMYMTEINKVMLQHQILNQLITCLLICIKDIHVMGLNVWKSQKLLINCWRRWSNSFWVIYQIWIERKSNCWLDTNYPYNIK
jgi:hypothetical protein